MFYWCNLKMATFEAYGLNFRPCVIFHRKIAKIPYISKQNNLSDQKYSNAIFVFTYFLAF